MCTGEDSNLQPSGPKPDALSIELPVQAPILMFKHQLQVYQNRSFSKMNECKQKNVTH